MSATATATSPEAQTQTLSGSEVVLRALIEQGVEVVFGYPGGAVLPLYDAFFKQNSIRQRRVDDFGDKFGSMVDHPALPLELLTDQTFRHTVQSTR